MSKEISIAGQAAEVAFYPAGIAMAPDKPADLDPVARAAVKDAWTRFLPLSEMLIELFFERLLVDAPDLKRRFGAGITRAPELFLWLFDTAVRNLDPATEVPLREGYSAPPGLTPSARPERVEIGRFFADHGMTERHWRIACDVFLSVLARVPTLDETRRRQALSGPHSPFGRFFSAHVMAPMIAIAKEDAVSLRPSVVAELRADLAHLRASAQRAGTRFYQTLFDRHPRMLEYFGTTDMDWLAKHFIDALDVIVGMAEADEQTHEQFAELATHHRLHGVMPESYPLLVQPLIETIAAIRPALSDDGRLGWRTLLERIARLMAEPVLEEQRILKAARTFIELCARELGWDDATLETRWTAIAYQVRTTGTYTHTLEELTHGARVAWRHAPKCVGRISWRTLEVRDRRHLDEPETIFAECARHMRDAVTGGIISSIITVFRPQRPGERWGPRIWNSQMIRYAAYRQPDGSVLGDGANLELTAALVQLGWQPPEVRTAFDLLPIAVDLPDRPTTLFELDRADVDEVPIEHPHQAGIGALGLKWCAVPILTNFRLEIGGIRYGCAPFNGWFMESEIARNLFEDQRYGQAEAIARALDLDTSNEATLWRDRAFLELCAAIVHSFAKRGVTIVDHQTAAQQFIIHDERERRAGRECPAQWSWVTPSVGGAAVATWHMEMRDFHLSPHYGYAADRWVVPHLALPDAPAETSKTIAASAPLIVYASETGTAERVARQAARRLGALSPRVASMEDVDLVDLQAHETLLIVSATFGDGDPPAAGAALLSALEHAPDDCLIDTRFAVLGLGSRVYPAFCAAAQAFHACLNKCGAEPIAVLERADELSGQTDTIRTWIEMLAATLDADHDGVNDTAPDRPRLALIPAPTDPVIRDEMPSVAVTANRELFSDPAPGRSMRLIGFDLGAAGLSYKTSDYLAVHPVNPPALVSALQDRLGLDDDAWVRATGDHAADTGPFHRYRTDTPVSDILSRDLDLSLPPDPVELLSALRATAKAEADRDTLDGWLAILNRRSDDPERLALHGRLRREMPTVPCLLTVLPSATIDLGHLVEILPPLKPRYYSIACSALTSPREARILVSVQHHADAADRGGESVGLCSGWLATLAEGDRVKLAVRSPGRRIPPEFAGPLLLVGAGSGLASPLALLAERAGRAAERPHGPVALYFGCREPGEAIFGQELKRWRDIGVLAHLTIAFSRYGARRYVQHLIARDAAKIWRLLENPETRIMICGDARMAAGVLETLVSICATEGGLGRAGAADHIRRMRDTGAYVEDVWSVAPQGEPGQQPPTGNRATAWLDSLRQDPSAEPGSPSSTP